MKAETKKILMINVLVLMVVMLNGVIAFAGVRGDSDTAYPVEGGNIYFNTEGVITDSDSTVTRADIPDRINGIAVTSIGYSAFSDCVMLESVSVPSGVIEIDSSAFSDCTALKKITVPESVVKVDVDAFKGCVGIKTAGPIGGGYDYEFGWKSIIPDNAFNGCINLESVDIPQSLVTIGCFAFKDCSVLRSVSLPETMKSIALGAFDGCSSLEAVDIPDKVVYIGPETFANCTDLTSVSLPEGLNDTIENSTFENCKALKSVSIPAGVKYIGDRAFNRCLSLSSVEIPQGVESIGAIAFQNCISLNEITLPEGLREIGIGAFAWCASVKNITIPKTVITIEDRAFYGCQSLADISVDKDNSTFISVDGILFTRNRTDIVCYPSRKGGDYVIPGDITTVRGGAFGMCKDLKSVTIPEGVKEIGDFAFTGCNSLTDINVAKNNDFYTSVNGVLFNKDKSKLIACPGGLTGTYTVPDYVMEIGTGAFTKCSGLTSVIMPERLIDIGEEAFNDCTGLTTVRIPNGVGRIANYTFANCTNLKSVTIPRSVREIEDYTFYDSALTDVYYLGTMEQWNENIVKFLDEKNTELASAVLHTAT